MRPADSAPIFRAITHALIVALTLFAAASTGACDAPACDPADQITYDPASLDPDTLLLSVVVTGDQTLYANAGTMMFADRAGSTGVFVYADGRVVFTDDDTVSACRSYSTVQLTAESLADLLADVRPSCWASLETTEFRGCTAADDASTVKLTVRTTATEVIHASAYFGFDSYAAVCGDTAPDAPPPASMGALQERLFALTEAPLAQAWNGPLLVGGCPDEMASAESCGPEPASWPFDPAATFGYECAPVPPTAVVEASDKQKTLAFFEDLGPKAWPASVSAYGASSCWTLACDRLLPHEM